MKVDRLVSIIMILLEKDRVSAQELADLFEVSPRTIYRDIDAITMAGIPVRAVPGVGGGFEIMEQYKVDKKVFSASDLSALLMGLSSLSSMIRGDELVHALAKVKSFIPADKAQEIEVKANQIWIDMSPWMGSRNIKPYLQMIQAALQEHQLISFSYSDHRGNSTSRIVEPYQLVLKSGHWYVQGYCHIRNDYRLFKLSRMTDLQVRQETFTPRVFRKPVLDYSDVSETMESTVKLRIHRSVMDRVLDLCAYEHFSPNGSEHFIVDFPLVENDYYYDFLLGFGDKCECLEPPHVREEMRRRIQAMARIYET